MGLKRGWFLAAVYDESDNTLYYIGNNINGFYSWDLSGNVIKMLDPMYEIDFNNEMFNYGLIQNQYIFFPPRNESKLFWFDKIKGKMGYKDLYTEDILKKISYRNGFYGHLVSMSKNNTAYIFYREYPIVTIIEEFTNEYKYVYLDKWCEEFCLANGYVEYNGVYYLPFAQKNKILVFDSKKMDMHIIEIESLNVKTEGFDSIEIVNGTLFLLVHNSSLIVGYDLVSKRAEQIDLKIDWVEGYNTRKIIYTCDNFLIVPMVDDDKDRNEYVYKFDRDFHITEKVNIFGENKCKKKWNIYSDNQYEWYVLYEQTINDFADKYWAQECEIARINLKTLEAEMIDYPITEGDTIENISKRIEYLQTRLYVRSSSVTLENIRTNLDNYLYVIKNGV